MKKDEIRILVAFECSQRVTEAFIRRGFIHTYSCDIKPCEGVYPEHHFTADAYSIIEDGNWDFIIAHPPCTYLSTAATRSHSLKRTSEDLIQDRVGKRIDAINDFMRIAWFIQNEGIPGAIENPVGVMSTIYRPADQYIHPWEFDVAGNEHFSKRTGLWLYNGLPKLVPVNEHPMKPRTSWTVNEVRDPAKRAVTFKGIANAMADQWGDYLERR